ncbi:hypothetical protein Aduo_019620 [Ancylostoma duodenale]
MRTDRPRFIPPRRDPPLTLEDRIAEMKERFRAKSSEFAAMESRYDDEITSQCNIISQETMELAPFASADVFHRVYLRFHYIVILKKVREKLRSLKKLSQSMANQLEPP